MGITRPQIISPEHELDQFHSGEPTTDDWLKTRAIDNQNHGVSTSYVVTAEGDLQVVGFYSLSASGVARRSVKRSHGMPDPIPVLLMSQLAVDCRYQDQGIAKGLIKHALLTSLVTASRVGIVGVLVDALTDDVAKIYKKFGFKPYFKEDPLKLMVRMKDVAALFR